MKRQHGSMLVMALFVLIVLAFLGTTMVKVLSSASQSVVYEVLGTRAVNAAQSGLQQVVASAFPLNASAVACDNTLTSAANFSDINGLNDCDFQARCTTSTVVKDGITHFYYRFSSTGVCQADDVWVSRTVSLDALQEQ